MIEDYRSLAVFVAVADIGSFSGAGRRLKLSTSVVSHHVSKLEAKLGVSLLFRSTRSLSLTPDGQAILSAARRMVEAGEEALDALSDTSEQPVGALRITMPAFGDRSDIHKAVWAFAKDHPMVALSFSGSDRPIDLVKEGFDLAIRLGVLADSSLMSRKIGEFHRVLVASPGYLQGRQTVKTIKDLMQCDFISISMLSDAITLAKQGEEISFEPENVRLEVDSIASAKSAILAGVGVQHLPLSEAKLELETGEFVELVPDWKLPTLGIYTVWPDIGPQKKLTRRFIDFLNNALT